MFEINYYRDSRGRAPAKEFINSLDTKARAKIFSCLELLEEYGHQLGMPFSRHLADGIFEARVSSGGEAVRVLYFFIEGKKIILTNGFMKKTRKTPVREIERARRAREDWRNRHE